MIEWRTIYEHSPSKDFDSSWANCNRFSLSVQFYHLPNSGEMGGCQKCPPPNKFHWLWESAKKILIKTRTCNFRLIFTETVLGSVFSLRPNCFKIAVFCLLTSSVLNESIRCRSNSWASWVGFFHEFEWLTWLRFWVLSQDETIITIGSKS